MPSLAEYTRQAKMNNLIFCLAAATLVSACNREAKTDVAANDTTSSANSNMSNNAGEQVKITPIEHASVVLNWRDTVIYVDPVGGAAMYAAQPKAALVLVTDIHSDHMDAETLKAVSEGGIPIIAPQAVKDRLPADLQSHVTVLGNGQTHEMGGWKIEAIPMYNTTADRLQYHAKGRGNGYVIENNGVRVYLSGDTEDIPEMRALKNIDVAFVCMNLPYTMTEEQAASAVAEFKPKLVYPYHYRGTDGMSDVAKFKQLVNEKAPEVQVMQLNWYPAK